MMRAGRCFLEVSLVVYFSFTVRHKSGRSKMHILGVDDQVMRAEGDISWYHIGVLLFLKAKCAGSRKYISFM